MHNRSGAAFALVASVAFGLALTAAPAQAQSWGDRLKKAAKEATKEKVIEKVTTGGAGTAPKVEEEPEAGAGAVERSAAGSGKAAGASAGTGAAATSAPAASEADDTPGKGAWTNYDFKPGERPLFVDDFSKDVVGDFPRRLEFERGNMEVAEWKGGRWLRVGESGRFWVPLKETLPERFTIEFDYAGISKYELKITFSENPDSPMDQVHIGAWGSGISGQKVDALAKMPEDVEKRTVKVRVMADGRYIKVYVDSQRVANVPNADLGRTNKIHFTVPAYGEVPGMIANLRVMAGGRDLYDALAEDGRVATQGIYFATGSDVIRGESTPTLKEITAMLQEHAELKLTIEGHTDNVGNAAANQALSEKRAAAVRKYLIEQGIDAARLESKGLGDTKPAAANTTPEGRQQNRRVELVKTS